MSSTSSRSSETSESEFEFDLNSNEDSNNNSDSNSNESSSTTKNNFNPKKERGSITTIDPHYAPKILRKNNSISRVESLGSLANESKVLVLYTGGTIGMVKTRKGVYEPRAGVLEAELKKYPQLHDPEYVVKYFHLPDSSNAPLVLPDTGESSRVVYTIYEYEPLLDSSNMTVDDWVHIAFDIKNSYQHFNGFVILHGTDTMSYTASALSYMLENLGKTVIITGSQIPLFEPRSDGHENLLNSLILAGNYCIPEVAICFNNKLYRGNRTSKISASEIGAFDSPNMPPLATIGIKINVNWNNVFRSPNIAKFRVHSVLSRNVGLLRLFPSITVETIRAFLQPPIEGVVLQSYGAGNAPSNRQDILDEFRNASKRGVIIVNITQCLNGKVDPSYETGNALLEAGVICGSDMTPEAALTKLAYVLTKNDWSLQVKRKMIETNLRGELTVYKDHKFEDLELIKAVGHVLKVSTSEEMESLRLALYPAMVCAISAKGDLDNLIKLHELGAVDLSQPDYDLRTPLHLAASNGHTKVVEFLLSEGASVHAKDKNQETPLQIAVKNDHTDIIKLLRKAGGNLDVPKQKIGDLISSAAAKGDLSRIKSYHLAGAPLNEIDSFGRTAFHVAVEKDQSEVVGYLVNVGLSLVKHKNDLYGHKPMDIAKLLNRKSILNILENAPVRSQPIRSLID